MNNTLLYSAKELTTLRANKKAQRQLDLTQRQLDQERSYVTNDWNRRMAVFVSQKKKHMPKGWDHTQYRPHTAMTPITFSNGGLTGEYGAPVLRSSKVPRQWQLKACYVKMADGSMVPRSPSQTIQERQQSAKPKRATSAPTKRFAAPRPHKSATFGRKPSFLVTQLEMEDSLLRIDDSFDNSHNDSSLSNGLHSSFSQRPFSAMNGNNTLSRPPSGQILRPKSNTLGLKNSRTQHR